MPSSRSNKKPLPSYDVGMDWAPLELPDPPRPSGPKEPEAVFRVPTSIEIGLCVRARRDQLKIGQADVARQVGVGRQWIIALESGKARIDMSLVLKTLEVLALDLRLFVRDPPDWSRPLTAAAGTPARPYGKVRRWRVRPKWGTMPLDQSAGARTDA